MEKEQFLSILTKHLKGDANPAEEKFLFAYYKLFMADQDVLLLLQDNEKEKLKLSIKSNIDAAIQPMATNRHHLWQRIFAAASIVLVVAGLALLYTSHDNRDVSRASITAAIRPGTNAATLTLGNGKKIILSGAVNGHLAKEAGVSISKTKDGQIVYEIASGVAKETANYNVLSTANGEQYQVILPDQTKVWLNAASSIKYPASFSGLKKRTIILKGEAYFEVAKDKLHPFIVKTHTQEVKVLGTHFNINSYDDEPGVKTTLLEGAVHIGYTADHDGNGVTIKPGQQVYNINGRMAVTEVIAGDAIAWKEGYFRFNNETMDVVMKKITRWYDVTISYNDPALKKQNVYGSLSRFSNINDVLKLLELTGTVKFKIEGKQITAFSK